MTPHPLARLRAGWQMRSHVRVALTLLSAIGVLAILAGMIAFNVSENTLAHQQTLQRASEQRAQIRDLLSGLLSAEISQHSYSLTGEARFHDQFDRNAQRLSAALDRLRASFGAPPEKAARARELSALAEVRLRQLGQMLERGEAEPPAGPETAFRTVERINALAREMTLATERENLEASRVVHERIRHSRLFVLGLLGLIVVLVTCVVLLALAYLGRRSRVEAELRQAMALSRQASEAKTQFLAAMSHEIRTPLTGILGYTELLLEEDLPPHQRAYVQHLQAGGVGLSTLIDGVLELAKIESREITVVEDSLSIGDLVTNVLSIVSLSADQRKVTLRGEVDPALPAAVLGAEKRLRQVLLNLLSNALKFTREGTVTLRVRHKGCAESGEIVLFEVADTGIGIPRDRQERLFRRFSQADPAIQREYGGTGLGLAISKKLVVLMGGTIGVESEEGAGSTFWFTLPMKRCDAPAEPHAGAMTAPPPAAPPAASGRILLVEDSPQNRDLVCAILRREGYRVDTAEDGEEGVAAARAAAYDLILMDMQMPRMNGVEATRHIRAAEGAGPYRPIVAMTANVLPEQRAALREVGVTDYIAKPFKKASLIATVGRWLSLSAGPAGPADAASNGNATAGGAALDASSLEALRELMGGEWVRANLTRLRDRLDQAFPERSLRPPRRGELQRLAHRIVGDAGLFGFADLSRACRALEDACAEGQDIGPALAGARQAAARTRRVFDELLVEAERP